MFYSQSSLTKENESEWLASKLNLTICQVKSCGIDIEMSADFAGEVIHSYYFRVKDNFPQEILKLKKWTVGTTICLEQFMPR